MELFILSTRWTFRRRAMLLASLIRIVQDRAATLPDDPNRANPFRLRGKRYGVYSIVGIYDRYDEFRFYFRWRSLWIVKQPRYRFDENRRHGGTTNLSKREKKRERDRSKLVACSTSTVLGRFLIEFVVLWNHRVRRAREWKDEGSKMKYYTTLERVSTL